MTRRFLRSAVVAAILALVPTTALAAPPPDDFPRELGGGTGGRFVFALEGTFLDSERCDFPVEITFTEWHNVSGRFSEPVTFDQVVSGEAFLVQRFGKHQVHGVAAFSDADGSGPVATVRWNTTLRRTDIVVNATFTDGLMTGTVTSTDFFSGLAFSVTVPGQGRVLADGVGHIRLQHTSHYVDGERIARSDVPFFIAGQWSFWYDEICQYL